MDDDRDISRAVRHFVTERQSWVPVLQAACATASFAEQYGGEFAGAWVLQRLRDTGDKPAWVPGLRSLLAYGLIVRVGTARRGRRAYYVMPDRQAIQQALAEIGHPVPTEMLSGDGPVAAANKQQVKKEK
jgi:hypothetical protein